MLSKASIKSILLSICRVTLLLWLCLFFRAELVNVSPIMCGSGFFINSDGYIVTANHVVSKSKTMAVLFKGQYYPADVVARNTQKDVAILHSQIPNTAYLRLSRQFDEGWILLYGYPDPEKYGMSLKQSVMYASKGFNFLSGTTQIKVEDAVIPGTSGGPIIDPKSGVVGLITTTIYFFNFGWGTTAEAIKNLADQYFVRYEYAEPKLNQLSDDSFYNNLVESNTVVWMCGVPE